MKSRINLLRKQMLPFVITGFLSTLIMLAFYASLYRIIYYQYAYLIAYIISVITLYFMNLRFVFKTNFSLKSALEFPLIYLLQYLAGAALLEALTRLGFGITYAPLIIIVFMLPITFLLNRIVFGRGPSKKLVYES